MRFEGLTHVIYQSYRASFDRTPAAVLGCLLVAVSLVVVAAAVRVDRRGRPQARSAAARRCPHRPIALGRWRWPAVAAIAGVLGAQPRRACPQLGDLAGAGELDHGLVRDGSMPPCRRSPSPSWPRSYGRRGVAGGRSCRPAIPVRCARRHASCLRRPRAPRHRHRPGAGVLRDPVRDSAVPAHADVGVRLCRAVPVARPGDDPQRHRPGAARARRRRPLARPLAVACLDRGDAALSLPASGSPRRWCA